MAGYVRGLTVVINGDTKGLNTAIAQARAQGRMLSQELSAVGKLLEFQPASTDLLVSRQRAYGQALARNATELASLRQAHAAYAAQVGPMTERQQRDFQRLRVRIRECELEYQNLRREMVQAGALAPIGMQKAAGAMRSFSERTRTAANYAAALSAALAYVGYRAARAAVEFEYAFADVRKTIQATESEYARLYDSVLNLSLARPSSATDIAYIMSLGGQLNIAAQYLEKFAATVADLDVATDMNLEDASLQLAQFMNITNTAQGDIDRLGATIVDLGNNSATTESAIMAMAMRIAGSGSNIGMTADQVLALATALSSVGIQAEMGGNAISTIMNRIDKDVALNNETLGVWASTAGMSAAEFRAAWESDVMSALMAVIGGMGTFKDEGNNLNLLLKDMGISYMRQVDTMQRLARTGDIVAGAVTRAGVAWKQNSALAREVGQRYQTAEAQIEMAKNSAYKAAVTLGNELAPAVRDAAAMAADLAQRFADMDERDREMVVTLAKLAVGAGAAFKAIQVGAGALGTLTGAANRAITSLALIVMERQAEAASTAAATAATATNTAVTNAAAAAHKVLAASALASKIAMGGIAALLVGGVIAAVAALAAAASGAAEEEGRLTAETKDLQAAVDSAERTYERMCDAYGEASDEALRAKGALDEARRAYEEGRETVADYTQSLSDLNAAYGDSASAMDEASASAEEQAASWMYLADQINQTMAGMRASEEKTARMVSLCDALNDAMGETVATYDGAADSIGMTAEALEGLVSASSRQVRAQAAVDGFNESVRNQIGLEAELADAERNLSEATGGASDTYREFAEALGYTDPIKYSDEEIQGLSDQVEALKGNLADAKQRQADYLEALARLQSEEAAVTEAVRLHKSEGMALADAVDAVNERMGTSIEVGAAEAQMRADSATAALEESEALAELSKKEEKALEALTELAMGSRDLSRYVAENGISLDATARRMNALGIEASDLQKDIESFCTGAAAAMSEFERDSEQTLDDYKANLQSHIDATREWNQNVSQAWEWAANDPAKGRWIASMAADKDTYIDLMKQMADGGYSAFDEMWSKQQELNELEYQQMASFLDQKYRDVFASMDRFAEAAASELGDGGGAAVSAFVEGLSGLGLCAEEILTNTADLTSYGMALLVTRWQAGAIDSKESFLSELQAIRQGAYDETTAAAAAIGEGTPQIEAASAEAGKAGGRAMGQGQPEARSSGRALDTAMASGIRALAAVPGGAASSVAASAAAAMRDRAARTSAESAGKYLSEGMAKGIWAGLSMVTGAAGAMARAAVAAARKAAEINSPSRAMMRVGAWYGPGLAAGIDAGAGEAEEAARAMALAAVSAASLSSRMGAVGGGAAAAPSAVAAAASGGQRTEIVNNVSNYSMGDITVEARDIAEADTVEKLFEDLKRSRRM